MRCRPLHGRYFVAPNLLAVNHLFSNLRKQVCFAKIITFLCLCSCPVIAANVDDLSFIENGGYIIITDCNNDAVGELLIPEMINGKPVTGIDSWAFNTCGKLTSIEIPKHVTFIGQGVFTNCPSLSSLSVNLENIHFQSVAGVLYDYSLSTLIRYPSAKTDDEYLVPDGVQSISSWALEDCTHLHSVGLSASLTTIEEWAFAGCSNLISVETDEGIEIIGKGAFSDCMNLEIFTIPTSVKTIGERAFSFCENLRSINIPKGTIFVGDQAFFYCSKLETINVEEDNSNYSSLGGVFFNKDKSSLIKYPRIRKGSTYFLPVTVTHILENAFRNCDNLQSIKFNSVLESISIRAFYECSYLTSVSIPATVTDIGEFAFYSCPRLSAIYFSGDTPAIGKGAFGWTPAEAYFFDDALGFSQPTWDYDGDTATDKIQCGSMGTRNEVKEWLIVNNIVFDQSLESDPLGMGRSLLWYYAFNIPYASGSPFPVGLKIQDGMFELSFFAGRQDVNYSVEKSSDLLSWTTEGVGIAPLDEMGYKKASISTGSDRAFSRVKVLRN